MQAHELFSTEYHWLVMLQYADKETASSLLCQLHGDGKRYPPSFYEQAILQLKQQASSSGRSSHYHRGDY
jgi:hypothetical protein